ncbi:MAG: hypothetical protein CMB67_05375 [Euryarchaeota archaeon]|nr:hypothetical protein [Euryarchaeota archaeon]
MSSNIEREISRLLSVSFRGDSEAKIGKKDLARMWSLELQWFSPEDSLSLVERLSDSGWLLADDDLLRPFKGIRPEDPDLGWQPFISRDLDFPKPPNIFESLDDAEETHRLESETFQEGEKESNWDDGEGGLATVISKLSGLGREEVIRRAKRKKRALGPVTYEMALLLLAREQNLDMGEIIGG